MRCGLTSQRHSLWPCPASRSLKSRPGKKVGSSGAGCVRSFRTRSPAIAKNRTSTSATNFLLCRHDYHVDVAGGLPTAHYVYDMGEAEGLRFPTKRRAYVRGPGLKPIRDLLMVSIDLSHFRLTT